MAGTAEPATSTSKKQQELSDPAKPFVCHSEAAHNFSDMGTTRLKSLSRGMLGISCFISMSGTCTLIFCTLPFFFCLLPFCFKLQPKGLWWEPKPTGVIQKMLEEHKKAPEKLHDQQNQQGVFPACLHKNVPPVLPVWLHWKTSTTVSSAGSAPPPKNTHVVIYDFGLPSNSFSRQVDPLENTFMQLLHDGNDFLVPHGHGAATFHQTPAWWWHIVPLPIQNHFSYWFLTTLLFNLSIFSALNFRAPCSLPQRK